MNFIENKKMKKIKTAFIGIIMCIMLIFICNAQNNQTKINSGTYNFNPITTTKVPDVSSIYKKTGEELSRQYQSVHSYPQEQTINVPTKDYLKYKKGYENIQTFAIEGLWLNNAQYMFRKTMIVSITFYVNIDAIEIKFYDNSVFHYIVNEELFPKERKYIEDNMSGQKLIYKRYGSIQ